jgi:hypothetical protein
LLIYNIALRTATKDARERDGYVAREAPSAAWLRARRADAWRRHRPPIPGRTPFVAAGRGLLPSACGSDTLKLVGFLPTGALITEFEEPLAPLGIKTLVTPILEG